MIHYKVVARVGDRVLIQEVNSSLMLNVLYRINRKLRDCLKSLDDWGFKTSLSQCGRQADSPKIAC